MSSGLDAAECIAGLGVIIAVLAFIFGIIKVRVGNVRNTGNGKYILRSDYESAHNQLASDVRDIREVQAVQGQVLARVDERTKMLARKNGIDK